MDKVKIYWKNPVKRGKIWVSHGKLAEPSGTVSGSVAEVDFAEASTEPGPFATLVHVDAGEAPFSFFLRDVSAEYPIYLPFCGAVVTTAEDQRGYDQIISDIAKQGYRSEKQKLENRAEYSYEEAAAETRSLICPAWLGVSKDMRIFQVGMRGRPYKDRFQTLDEIKPMFFSKPHTEEQLPEFAGHEYVHYLLTGRGVGCREQLSRRLEDGYLPILHMTDADEGVVYHSTYFATLEKSPLDTAHLRGTDMYVADSCGVGYMQTPEQQERTASLLKEELFREEETVLYLRVVMENTKRTPAYGFIRMPDPLPKWSDEAAPVLSEQTVLDPETGFLSFASSGRVCVAGALNGKPIPSVETAVLLSPKGKAVFEFKIPHTPVSQERAAALAELSFDDKLREAKDFWKNELADAATISLPEKRIEEMIKAGLLHIDIGFFGKNPDGPVVPIVGRYTAIGSESSPCIQFLDSVGMRDLTTRSLQFFVEKQHEDGFIQNFGGYMLETGSTLWCMGEHWRLTRDRAWLESVQECIKKAADYLIEWRAQNLDDSLKGGNGYGMITGKVADPEDHFHSFMLNAGAYAGMRSAGEMLENCCPEAARRYTEIAAEMRQDIRASFIRNMELSPVIPASDGTWFRSFAPWTGHPGPICLYAEGGMAFTHGSFTLRDLLGANYLVFQGVIDPEEPITEEILAFYAEIMTINNVCFSQPYYSPHPYIHLMRGEVKLLLEEFYCGLAALADRETYSFWEHYFLASPHKLHEEGWFLMRCRWMLALEEYGKDTLRLLAGVPRAWLANGKQIILEHLKTYYGDISLTVKSEADSGVVHVSLRLDGTNFPPAEVIAVRIPHPDGRKARKATAGRYDPDAEAVLLEQFSGEAEFDLIF